MNPILSEMCESFLEFRSEIEPPYVGAYGGSNQRLNGRNKAAK